MYSFSACLSPVCVAFAGSAAAVDLSNNNVKLTSSTCTSPTDGSAGCAISCVSATDVPYSRVTDPLGVGKYLSMASNTLKVKCDRSGNGAAGVWKIEYYPNTYTDISDIG